MPHARIFVGGRNVQHSWRTIARGKMSVFIRAKLQFISLHQVRYYHFQMLAMDLHSFLGNRWSNEIKPVSKQPIDDTAAQIARQHSPILGSCAQGTRWNPEALQRLWRKRVAPPVPSEIYSVQRSEIIPAHSPRSQSQIGSQEILKAT